MPWFCSACTSHNPPETDRCGNLACNLLRKNFGVNIKPESEQRAMAVPIISVEKQKRCGECNGCKAPECGVCVMCKDMPKRGGKGLKKQPCELRVCERVRKGKEEREEELAEFMEAERQRKEVERVKREADRVKRMEAMAEERRQRLESKEAEKQAKIEAKMQAQVARARAAALKRSSVGSKQRDLKPPVLPTELAAYGWGVASSYPPGVPVEVLGVDEGIAGACFRAVAVEPLPSDLPNRPDELPPRPEPSVLQPPSADPAAAASSSSASEHGGGGFSSAFDTASSAWMLVEHLDLLESEEEGSPKLREWVSSDVVRLRPPDTPAGFLSMIRQGDRLQFLLDDAFWDVSLEAIRYDASSGGGAARQPEKPFSVASVLYQATHKARPVELRPLWLWGGMLNGDGGSAAGNGREGSDSVASTVAGMGTPCWRYELMCGSGYGEGLGGEDGDGNSSVANHVFVCAGGVARRHSAHYHAHHF